MNSSLVVPSLFARAAAEGQQREFTDGWDPLFIDYTAAVYCHTCDIKENSWTTQAKKMRGSMPPKFEAKPSEEEFTTQELLKDLNGESWADTATPPLTLSPRKNLELPLTSETSIMGMSLLSAEGREKNTFEGNRDMFLGTLDEDAWREFLSDFNREVDGEITLDDFKEELWDTVVKFGEPVLMGTGLEEKARGELLNKMVELRKASRKTKEDECKDSSTLKQKTVNKIIESVRGIRSKLVL